MSIAVDPETYPAALGALSVPATERRPAYRGAACAYVMPVVSNPRGRALTSKERTALLEAAIPIIEDDAYGDLSFGGPGPGALAAQAGSGSSTWAPSRRSSARV